MSVSLCRHVVRSALNPCLRNRLPASSLFRISCNGSTRFVSLLRHKSCNLPNAQCFPRARLLHFESPTQDEQILGNARTIYALSTPPGKAGLAVIRISGPDSFKALGRLIGQASPPRTRYAGNRTLRHPITGEHLDDAIVLGFTGPKSFTGEDVVELHVHGGRSVVAGVLTALADSGLHPAEPGEFTKRAFYHGKLDLTAIEGLADLINAETEAQRRQALRQMRGELGRLYEGWREALLQCVAHAEAFIDFGEDDDIGGDVLDDVMVCIRGLRGEIERHLDDGRRGERLRDGVHVTIVGPPNAGKSSLLNILSMQRNAASQLSDIGGYPVLLADTAGIRDTDDVIEQEGVKRALARLEVSDVRICMIDVTGLFGPAASADSQGQLCDVPAIVDRMRSLTLPVPPDQDTILVFNKIDQLDGWAAADSRCEPIIEAARQLWPQAAAICTATCTTSPGAEPVVRALLEAVQARCDVGGEGATLTQARHRAHLTACLDALNRLEDAADMAIAGEELRLAIRHLGKITGRVNIEDVLDVIFSDFCIGK